MTVAVNAAIDLGLTVEGSRSGRRVKPMAPNTGILADRTIGLDLMPLLASLATPQGRRLFRSPSVRHDRMTGRGLYRRKGKAGSTA